MAAIPDKLKQWIEEGKELALAAHLLQLYRINLLHRTCWAQRPGHAKLYSGMMVLNLGDIVGTLKEKSKAWPA